MNSSKFVKDAFHRHVIHGEDCLNPQEIGTKAALHYRFAIPPGESVTLHFRLTDTCYLTDPLAEVGQTVDLRRAEADAYYATVHPPPPRPRTRS